MSVAAFLAFAVETLFPPLREPSQVSVQTPEWPIALLIRFPILQPELNASSDGFHQANGSFPWSFYRPMSTVTLWGS